MKQRVVVYQWTPHPAQSASRERMLKELEEGGVGGVSEVQQCLTSELVEDDSGDDELDG